MKKLTLSLMLLLAIILLPSVIFGADGNIAKMGETEYPTIQAAIDDINSSEQVTITLITDDPNETTINGGGFITNGENIIIDFNGKTYNVIEPLVGSTGTESNGCQLLKGSTVKFTNGTFKSDVARTLVQNYSNFTLAKNMTLEAENAVTGYALSNNCGIVSIEGNIIASNYAFDMCWAPDVWGANTGYTEGTQITVNTNGTIVGNIELGTWGSVTEPNKTNIKSTLKIDKIADFGGNIVVSKDYLKNQLTVSKDYEVRNVAESTNKYSLVKLHNVTIANTQNGTVKVDKATAAAEDTVKITAEPNAGYVLGTVKVTVAGATDELIVENNQFTMVDEPVIVTVVFNKLKQETEAPTINKNEEVKDVTIGVSNLEEANKVLLDTLANRQDLQNAIKDKNVKVEIDVKEIEAPKEDKTKIFEKLLSISENMKLSNFFDISIHVRNADNNVELGKLAELRSPIEFTVALPDTWDKVPEGYTRNIYIANLHGGEVKIIDNVRLSEDCKYATFATSHFSTYAIAYEDVKDVTDSNVPKTGDNIAIYTLLATLSVIGIVVLKKVNNFKSKH